uniref:NADH dehydrogenase subunit 3 n=1 Tax=Polymyxa betae TaxID=41456 RepID=UPI001D103E9C|nr:NADH dehydrogenase subunit 3 [Polymyxa betae]CAG9644865.1 NADH dehydrogenase subunit 3 [Polymyxa betae]
MIEFLYTPSNFIEYNLFFIYLVISVLIALIIIGLSQIVSEKKLDLEKLSAYECGFDPFGDARHTFNVKFYLVAILFIIFDLEIVFLFPWAITVNSYQAFYSMMCFLIILTIGFIYEWKRGALDW